MFIHKNNIYSSSHLIHQNSHARHDVEEQREKHLGDAKALSLICVETNHVSVMETCDSSQAISTNRVCVGKTKSRLALQSHKSLSCIFRQEQCKYCLEMFSHSEFGRSQE